MKAVYLVSGARTPQVKAGGEIKDLSLPFLGSSLIRHLLDETTIENDQVDEVIVGNTGAPAKFPNIGRIIALEAGLNKKTSGYTVHRNCASGMEAISQGFDKIALGRADIVLAGGVESMSQMPLIYGKEMTDLFVNVMKAKTTSDKLKALGHFRPNYLTPVIAIEQGLTDPFCGLNMGQTAELLAREFGISREQQDEFANESHHRAVNAQEKGHWRDEIVPLFHGPNLDKLIDADIGPRGQSNMESLAKLKPFFDRKAGTVTVGNSCPITDGGSMTLLASEEAVQKYNLKPMAKIHNYHFHGLEPERMGMGPLLAMQGVLERTEMKLEDMDLVEINEAFSAQVLAVLMACKEERFAKKFGVETLGEISRDKLNINGGGIALGHPVGSTGSRIVVTLAHALKRTGGKFGIASLCIGGGQGGACLIENLSEKVSNV